MKSEALKRLALHPLLALSAAALAFGGCAVSSDSSTEPSVTGSTSSSLTQISDQEYVLAVHDVLGITLAGSDANIAGLETRSADTLINDMTATSYQLAAQKVAGQASVGALLGSESPSTAQVQSFISARVAQLWHRPLTHAEVDTLTSLYNSGTYAGAANGLGLVLEAVLQAPSFIFRS